MTLLIIYLSVALGFSFLCSVLEAVVLSVTPSYVARLVDEQPKAGAIMKELKEDVDRPLAAILILNTIAHTVGAAGVGAEAQRLWGSEILAVASALLTLAIVVFSEIIPKTLGATYWRRLAPGAARVSRWLVRALYPLVLASEQMTRLLKKKDVEEEKVSREEIEALARLGGEQGVIAESESRIIKNLFRLGSVRVRDVMTPRTVMFTLHAETTVGDAIETEEAMTYSRIPIHREGPDDVDGYVLKDELFMAAARDETHRRVGSLKRDLFAVLDTLSVSALFEQLLEKREHVALVVDEYGGVDGVVTMEDVLETLLGMEIVDEADTVQDLRVLARRKWRERAMRLGSEIPEPLEGSQSNAEELASGEVNAVSERAPE